MKYERLTVIHVYQGLSTCFLSGSIQGNWQRSNPVARIITTQLIMAIANKWKLITANHHIGQYTGTCSFSLLYSQTSL